MYSRESVGPRMEPGETPSLTRYYCEPLEVVYYWEKTKED